MTYQVLARKWRPRNFKEVAGQSHVLKTLINSLDNNRLHHAYLFTGTRGVGKTSIARILARCLNCEDGVSSEPCGQCSACTEIDEGRFIDLIEVDAASRTKVEDTRELLDNVQYAPSRGRFKVYLIDEVHMLSGHSFNALLKTLEEPPPHVKFLLATTDPQKLPITVLSRCLQFSLKNLSPERIMEHLKTILEHEKIDFEEPALWQLGRAAQGSVRDALTLLDQAISFSDSKVSEEEVSSFLGTIDQAIIHGVMDALIANDAKKLLDLVSEAADHAPDFAMILEELLSYLHRVAIAQVVPSGADNSQGDQKSILAHAESIAGENVQLYYQIALKGREELPLSVDTRSGLEMTLLRMLAFTPQGVPNVPTFDLPSSSSEGSNDQSSDSEKQLKKKPVENNGVSEFQESERPAKVLETLTVAAKPPSDKQGLSQDKKEEERQQEKQVEESGTEKSAIETFELKRDSLIKFAYFSSEQWITVFYGLELSGITRSIAANCLLVAAKDNKITMSLAETQSAVYNEEHKKRIEGALQQYFSKDIELEIEIGTVHAETPALFRDRKELERKQKAHNTFHEDPNVQAIVKRFDGVIQEKTIEPLTLEDY